MCAIFFCVYANNFAKVLRMPNFSSNFACKIRIKKHSIKKINEQKEQAQHDS